MAKMHYNTSNYSTDGDMLRGAVLNGILELLTAAPTLPLRYRTALGELRKRDDIVILPADKSSRLVLLDRAQYVRDAEHMLSDETTYKELTKGNPILSRVRKLNGRLKNIQATLPCSANGVASTVLKRFHIHNESEQKLGYAYFLPKDHKPHPPLTYRPIISQCAAFMTPLSKYVASILAPLVGTFSSAHLTNSRDLTTRLTTLFTTQPHLLSAPMLSLDVQSLFTNVPLKLVTSFLRKKFSDNNLQLPPGLTIDALVALTELCCESTIFTFNGRFYQQKFGVAMGSPLACILANIMMECMEGELMSMFPVQPAVWLRYVDDILCIWPHGMEHFQQFLDGLNSLIPSIKLTAEWESRNINTGISTLPFLDVLIHRSSSAVSFSVYRKPSHVHSYMHYFSNHAPHIKKGVLSGLFTRALRVSSPHRCPLLQEIVNIYILK